MKMAKRVQVAAGAGVIGLALVLVSCAGGGGGASRPVSRSVEAGAIRSAASDGLLALAPSLGGGRHAAFKQYDPKGAAVWADGAVRAIDLSGVAFDDSRTATLITPQHVLMAKHYARKVGSRLVFHDRSGQLHEAFLMAVKTGPNDLAVGQLNRPMPVRPYRVLSPRKDYGSLLNGVPVVVTNRKRVVFCHAINQVTDGGWVRFGASPVPGVAGNLTVGDSGNPSFLLVHGEPILIETHTSGGFGAGPFVSDPANFAVINRLIAEMGGGGQLSVLAVR